MSSTDLSHKIACPECDLLLERPVVLRSQTAHCPRCGSRLLNCRHNSIERSLALALAGLILLFPANLFPILSLQILGLHQQQTIFSSAMGLYGDDLGIVALTVLLFAIVVPACKLALLAYVSAALQFNRPWPLLPLAMRYYQHLDEWAMLEVYLIAVLVSIVKLIDIATVHPGVGLYSLAALILITTLSSTLLDRDLYWQLIGERAREPSRA